MTRRHLTLIEGGKKDENQARLALYPVRARVVRAEPKPDPHPPKAAA